MNQDQLIRSYPIQPHDKQGFSVSKDEFYKIGVASSAHKQRVLIVPQQIGDESLYLAENKNDSPVTIKIYKQ